MIINKSKLIKRKRNIDKCSKGIILFLSLISVSIILVIIGFIFIKTLPMFRDQEWAHKFNAEYGIFNGLMTTFVIAAIALTIAMWIGTRIAIFIFFKIKSKKLKTILRFINELLAGIPSVIFGLFGIFALSPIIGKWMNTNFTTGSIYSVVIILAMMVIPTVSSLTLNALKGVPTHHYQGALALGVTKNQSIYKVVLKSIRKQRVVIMMLSLGRVIGETMAVSMLIQSHPVNPFTHQDGILGFLRGNSGNVATIIPNNMFPQSGDLNISRGYVYAIGFIILVFILILNAFIAYVFRNKENKKIKVKRGMLIKKDVKNWIKKNWISNLINIKNKVIYNSLFFVKEKQNRVKVFYHFRKTVSEIIAVIFGFSLVFWIFGYVLIKGGHYFEFQHLTNPSANHGDTVGQALIVTCILVLGSIAICIPFALSLAIWFSEYAQNTKPTKVMRFLIDALQSTPSILFGMFGMVFFIQTLHVGRTFSLTAGILTMSIVILPMFTRTIEQSLQVVPMTLRHASIALGETKFGTICKVVLPTALKGIVTGVILSIGRIISETAPVYLVMGLSPAWFIKGDSGAQVITTRIYVNVTTPSNLSMGNEWAWETSFVAMILIMFLYIFANTLGWYLEKRLEGKLKFKKWIKLKVKEKNAK